VFVVPPAIPKPLMLIVRMLYVVPEDAVDAADAMFAPVHITAAASAQMDFDAVSVIVPPFGIVFAGVTTNVTAVGVLGKATPPVATADVHPIELVVGAFVGDIVGATVGGATNVYASPRYVAGVVWEFVKIVAVTVASARPFTARLEVHVIVTSQFPGR